LIFAFRLGKTLVEFLVQFHYNSETFDFNVHNIGLEQNIELIEERLADIDQTRNYRFIACNPIEFNNHKFFADWYVGFYQSATLMGYSLRNPSTLLPAEALTALNVWNEALRPVLIGTILAHRQQVHDAAKQFIRDQARRQATNLRDNGVVILKFLG
jgi:hypothetical protein